MGRKTQNLAASDFCLSAIDAYKKAGEVDRVKALEKKYTALNASKPLKSHLTDFN